MFALDAFEKQILLNLTTYKKEADA